LIRIGIVDDHPVFRLGLTRLFDREPDLTVVWDVGSAATLHEMMGTEPADVVLMDLNLGPDEDALAATSALREKFDSVKVIVISASLDWEAATAARAAGASGYLPKDLSVEDMVAAIRGLSTPDFGRRRFTDLLKIRPNAVGSVVPMLSALTRRENEVLYALRRGQTNMEIAAHFGVSITTVNKHVQQVLKKLHARTRAQAVAMVNADALGRPYRKAGQR